MKQTDKKGIFFFLAITFLITYGIEFALLLSDVSPIVQGFGQFVVAGVMWVPAFSAWVTIKFVTKEESSILRIRFGEIKPYLKSALLIPLCFLLIFGLTWALGFGNPDFEMGMLKDIFAKSNQEFPEVTYMTWFGLFIATTLFAPFLNSLFGFGEELGWRGYLLFKLLPLGKMKANIILAIVWSLWHMPLVIAGFMYPGYPVIGNVFFFLLTLSLGFYMNELTIKYNSSILAGWLHGLFNSQRLGVWALLFPSAHPLIGGQSGLIGVIVWTILGYLVYKQIQRKSSPTNSI